MGGLQILFYGCVAVFVIATIARLARYARAPVHLRWELYPVAHERGRHQYGGSVFEEPDWWRNPSDPDRVNEIREMAREIFLLQGVRRHNRSMWFWSWPFHVGLYLLIAWMLSLLVPTAAVGGTMARVVEGATAVLGHAGLVMTTVGALGLFALRAGDRELRRYNTRVDYLHLVGFIVAAGVGLVAFGLGDPAFTQLRAWVAAAIRLQSAPPLPLPVAVSVALGLLLIAYIPFTRMIHFAAKYFLYHDVRWSDEPLRRGGKLEQRLHQALNFGVGWRAKHVPEGGTWAEAVAQKGGDPDPAEETRS